MPLNTSDWPKPDLPAIPQGVDNHGTARMILDQLFGRHPEYMIAEPGRALLVSTVRLMDKTVTEYLAAHEAAVMFANGNADVRAGRPSDYFRVIDHLETCIGTLHRALLHVLAISAHRDAPIVDRTQRHALSQPIARINAFRDSIEHADEHIRRTPGATTSTWTLDAEVDAIRLGAERITYADLVLWIGQTARLLQTLLPR